MKAFEYTKRENMEKLDDDTRKFVAKMIVREVKRIAEEHNISEEAAYWGYAHGLYGADRDMG